MAMKAGQFTRRRIEDWGQQKYDSPEGRSKYYGQSTTKMKTKRTRSKENKFG